MLDKIALQGLAHGLYLVKGAQKAHLWMTRTSPFVRKVRVVAEELGLSDSLELVAVDPWEDIQLRTLNPLGKVPVLVDTKGYAYFESSVICEYLLSLRPTHHLNLQGPERLAALLKQGMADGACTAAGRLFADENRPANQQSDTMLARFRLAIETALDWTESHHGASLGGSLGDISIAVFVSYLDFRWPSRNWRGGRPHLAGWYDEFRRRTSMTNTEYALST